MSNKKLLAAQKLVVLTTAAISTLTFTSLFAGGIEVPPPPSPCGIYLEADFGYSGTNWQSAMPSSISSTNVFQTQQPNAGPPTLSIVLTRNGTGGFTWGGDLGYQFNSYLAAEAGGFMLPTPRFSSFSGSNAPGGTSTAGTGSISHWFVYGAGKVLLPLTASQNIALFAKAGVAYRDGSVTQTITSTLTTDIPTTTTVTTKSPFNGFAPIGGVGAQFSLCQNWIFNTQFLVIPSTNVNGAVAIGGGSSSAALKGGNANTLPIPTTYLVTVGAGYKFNT